MGFQLFKSKKSFLESNSGIVNPDASFEKELIEICKKDGRVVLFGKCQACGNYGYFYANDNFFQGKILLREQLNCPVCGMAQRFRFTFDILKRLLSFGQKIYLTEQITAFYSLFGNVFKNLKLDITGSEFSHAEGVNFQDLTNVTFDDNIYDFVVCSDVLEHLPDVEKAVSEIYRVTKPDGMAIISVPMDLMLDQTLDVSKEGFIHIDPLNPAGCMVYNHFGWDFLDMLRIVGFRNVDICTKYDPLVGYVGNINYKCSDWFGDYGFHSSIIARK